MWCIKLKQHFKKTFRWEETVDNDLITSHAHISGTLVTQQTGLYQTARRHMRSTGYDIITYCLLIHPTRITLTVKIHNSQPPDSHEPPRVKNKLDNTHNTKYCICLTWHICFSGGRERGGNYRKSQPVAISRCRRVAIILWIYGEHAIYELEQI